MVLKDIIHQIMIFTGCVFQMIFRKHHKFPLFDANSGKTAYILVNGPSLKKTLDEYDENKYAFNEDSFFVNLGPLDPRFLKIRPKHFCLSDPIFYQDFPSKKEQVRKMYDILETQVDWDMYLYMDFFHEWEYDKLIEYSRIKNPKIHFVRLNRKSCSHLWTPIRHWMYKRQWFMPEDGTIANVAIYLAIIEGYKEIELYGADHTMFLELAVNENNELCSLDSHFYEDGKPVLKPLKNCLTTDDRVFKVHEFLHIVTLMFYSHSLIRAFSDYMGAHVLNCTKGSMIDVYDRKQGC